MGRGEVRHLAGRDGPGPLYRTTDADALPTAHPEIDGEEPRQVEKGRRSPLAALRPKTGAKAASAPA